VRRLMTAWLGVAVLTALGLAAGPPEARSLELLKPLPDHGAVPAIVDMRGPSEEELASRARTRRYAQQIRAIRHKHFGSIKVPAIRAEGMRQIAEFTDPAAFRPLLEEFARERDDVRFATLDHFVDQGDDGQGALAWVAIHDESDTMRQEAMRRMVSPPPEPVLRLLDQALRSPTHGVANHAGALAGTLGAIDVIPLLIFAQATRDPYPSDVGDLAWIAIQTQTAYVQNVQPVVGDNAGAFQPVIGVINEGSVLRVIDAVVIVYRTVVHHVLVTLTTDDWGRPTEHLGYDMNAWWEWYNGEYVPFKNEEIRLAALAREPEAPADAPSGGP
jgi:hypothetical protein